MADASLNVLVRHLRRLAGREGGGLPDAELLERFLTGRDELAFEVLLWRHGPMVLGTCRRILRHEQDVEDAFQATFLTLLRKGRNIGRREAIGSWLYRVAYRVALRARADTARRAALEAQAPLQMAVTLAEDVQVRELRAVLDEEIAHLPARYRVPLILYHLQGKTLEEIAGQLGAPAATIGTWLARGRARLRTRLARRGLTDALGAVGFGRTESLCPATIPVVLAEQTLETAALFSAGSPQTAIPARILALSEGVVRTMTMSKAKWACAALLTLCLLGAGTSQFVRRAEADQKAAAPNASNGSTSPPTEETGVLRWRFANGVPFYQTMEATTNQTLGFQGSEVKQTQRQTFYSRWTPASDSSSGGDQTLKQRIEGVKTDLNLGGSSMVFDSTKEAPADSPLASFYKALIGAEFTVVLGPDFRAREIKGQPDELIRRLSTLDPGLEAMFREFLTQDALKAEADRLFASPPHSRMAPGESWARKNVLNLGQAGSFEATYKYTYQGRQDGLDRVSVEGIVIFLPCADKKVAVVEGRQGVTALVRQVDIKNQKVVGTILFNSAKGRLVRSEMTTTIAGTMTLEIAGQTNTVDLVQEQKVVITTSATSPLNTSSENVEGLKRENERLRKQLQAIEEIIRRGKEGPEKK